MKIDQLRSGFPPSFWIANTLELFERLAFYGAKAVLAVFLANQVGLEKEAGTLAGIFSGVIYTLPILAGVLVDRYGFRKTLTACFAIFTVGYFLIAVAGLEFGGEIVERVGKYPYVLTVLLLTAVGGSLIKPCIVGTVSKTSPVDKKALGFSIYYTLVNIGGTLGPVLAGQLRQNLGIEYVLLMSSFTTFLLLIGTLIFFKEPASETIENTEHRTFAKVFSDMLTVFANFRFILFLIIFSGFWIMFWQIFYLMPFYGTDVIHFNDFELLEALDAFCIILLTVPVTALVKKWRPITAMTLGFIFASLSWLIIGFSPTVTAAFLGIGLFALGESTQAPRFYEYVSSLAPKDQIGIYMGFAFLPVAIGSFTAGPVSDWLRINYLHSDPATMWLIVAGIGFTSTILMIIYNVFIAKPAPDEKSNNSIS
jgi:proton-dependent oligopeptide transporter, POT family